MFSIKTALTLPGFDNSTLSIGGPAARAVCAALYAQATNASSASAATASFRDTAAEHCAVTSVTVLPAVVQNATNTSAGRRLLAATVVPMTNVGVNTQVTGGAAALAAAANLNALTVATADATTGLAPMQSLLQSISTQCTAIAVVPPVVLATSWELAVVSEKPSVAKGNGTVDTTDASFSRFVSVKFKVQLASEHEVNAVRAELTNDAQLRALKYTVGTSTDVLQAGGLPAAFDISAGNVTHTERLEYRKNYCDATSYFCTDIVPTMNESKISFNHVPTDKVIVDRALVLQAGKSYRLETTFPAGADYTLQARASPATALYNKGISEASPWVDPDVSVEAVLGGIGGPGAPGDAPGGGGGPGGASGGAPGGGSGGDGAPSGGSGAVGPGPTGPAAGSGSGPTSGGGPGPGTGTSGGPSPGGGIPGSTGGGATGGPVKISASSLSGSKGIKLAASARSAFNPLMDTTRDAFDLLDAFDPAVYLTAPSTDLVNVTRVSMPPEVNLYRPTGSVPFAPSERHLGKFPEGEVNPSSLLVDVALFTVPIGDSFPAAGTGGTLSLIPNVTVPGSAVPRSATSGVVDPSSLWQIRPPSARRGDMRHLHAADYRHYAFDRERCSASKDIAKDDFNQHCALFMPPTYVSEFAVRQPVNGRFEVPQGVTQGFKVCCPPFSVVYCAHAALHPHCPAGLRHLTDGNALPVVLLSCCRLSPSTGHHHPAERRVQGGLPAGLRFHLQQGQRARGRRLHGRAGRQLRRGPAGQLVGRVPGRHEVSGPGCGQ
jgi:hypothetical protein